MLKNRKEQREELTSLVHKMQNLIDDMYADGIEVAVSMPVDDIEKIKRQYAEADPKKIRDLQRTDVVRLKTMLEDDNNTALRFRGHYVGIIGLKPRAWAKSKQMVKLQLTERLGSELAKFAIILPVMVPDETANDDWTEIQIRLGFDTHPE